MIKSYEDLSGVPTCASVNVYDVLYAIHALSALIIEAIRWHALSKLFSCLKMIPENF